MRIVIEPGSRCGEISVPASKSQAHRQLICAALSKEHSVIFCDTISKDIEATIECLNGAGAVISVKEEGRIEIEPIRMKQDEGTTRMKQDEEGTSMKPVHGMRGERQIKSEPDYGMQEEGQLFCGESGSTLRFLIPVMGAIGKKCVFHMEGRLPERPISVFTDELCRHGMRIVKEGTLLKCEGKLKSGIYTIPGNISSQFISGLLMALPLLEGDSVINITESIESGDYLAMTEDAIRLSGIHYEKGAMCYQIKGQQSFAFPGEVRTEGDWSGAAFYICMGALSEKGVLLHGLSMDSSQGDTRIAEIVRKFGAVVEVRGSDLLAEEGAWKTNGLSGFCECSDLFVKKGELKGCTVDASEVPDLVPAIAALASVAEGETRIVHAERLKFKESDRIKTTAAALASLGADVKETEDGLVINGRKALKGGTADSGMDHRIAMMAAVAACACVGEVEILDCQCVSKSYPAFFEAFAELQREE